MAWSQTKRDVVINTAVRRQKTLTLNSENVEDSDFNDTAYNSTYVCTEFDSKKGVFNNFSAKVF